MMFLINGRPSPGFTFGVNTSGVAYLRKLAPLSRRLTMRCLHSTSFISRYVTIGDRS